MSLLLAAAQNADAPMLVAQNVAFGIIAAMMVFGAIRVVTTSNVVHAAVYLVMVFVRASADQRVHGIDDLESLAAELNVFGSIPRLRRAHPVGFSKGRSL